jgi:hypothetical protein
MKKKEIKPLFNNNNKTGINEGCNLPQVWCLSEAQNISISTQSYRDRR